MAGISSKKNDSNQSLEFQGFLNDLQDWERSLKVKDKNMRGQSHAEKKVAKGKTRNDPLIEVSKSYNNGLSTRLPRESSYRKQYDYFRNSEALSDITSVLSAEEIPDAASEKELGNEYYKKKQYKKAIECYSRSIALLPTAVAFANRGMAYLKIKRFEEAENDCTEALNLDDRYIKAYSRRATARKELGKLKASLEDADFARRLDPNDLEIKKLYSEVKALHDEELLGKANAVLKSAVQGPVQGIQALEESTVKSQSDENSHVSSSNFKRANVTLAQVEPIKASNNVGKKYDLKASVQELASHVASQASTVVAKNMTTPRTAYEFEVSWRALSNDPLHQACLLKTIPPTALPQLFKNALSASILVDVIKCLATFFMEEIELAVSFLYNLTQVPRFDMIIMCLSNADKADIKKIWGEVFANSKVPPSHTQMLARLRLKYCPGGL